MVVTLISAKYKGMEVRSRFGALFVLSRRIGVCLKMWFESKTIDAALKLKEKYVCWKSESKGLHKPQETRRFF